MITTVVKRVEIEAAHFLPNYVGKCSTLHGHRWIIEVGVFGEPDPVSGMVVDFKVLADFLDHRVVSKLDHHLINEEIKNPTAENICAWIWDIMVKFPFLDKDSGVSLVRVWETGDSYAEICL